MQRLEVSGAVRPIYGSLGVKRLNLPTPSLTRFHKLSCDLATPFAIINFPLEKIEGLRTKSLACVCKMWPLGSWCFIFRITVNNF